MSLAPGTHLGGYRIVGLLGEGGMGQVYRAHDEKLGREVALKILPDAFTHDADRLARFRREAQLLASLNHPNIAAIYGVEDVGDTRALVLELVEGPTLADLIAGRATAEAESLRSRPRDSAVAAARGGGAPRGLAIDEALAIARQIADALQAAHERGIIHRDLKPANVKVREDGTVKVLDFGLAKAAQNQASDSGLQAPGDLSQSPTITSPAMMTGVGMILGTAAYMAPEQAKGRPADKRSDVWAFGCVLYEMLAGKRPFGGDDVSDTLASVLKEEPDWTALPSTVPPAIRTLVQRCLVKDRHRRVADIAAAQFVLAEHAGLTTASGPTADANRSGRSGLAWMAAAVLLTAALFGAGVRRFWPADPPAPGMVRFTFGTPGGALFSNTTRQGVAISPDGTQIVYAAGGRLYRRAVDELESHAITTGMDLPGTPIFAPDGQSVAFYSQSERTLKRIAASGGTPTSIGGTRSDSPFGMNWGEGGIVFAVGRGGIFRVSPNGGEPEQIVRVEAGEIVWGPQLLPGGGSVLFTLLSDTVGEAVVNWDAAKVVVQSLTSGKRTVVINGGSDARYLSSGHLIYSVSGTVFAVGFDPASQATIGDAVPVLAGVRRSPAASGATQYSVSDTGALVYVPGPVNASSSLRNLVLVDRNGVAQPLKLAPAEYVHPRVSPDARRLAVGIVSSQQADVWVYDLDGASAIRRLTLQGRSQHPVWSADSQRVAFQSDREGDSGIFWQRADGSGAPERLTTAPKGAAHVPESWAPDGQHLLFSEVNAGSHVLLSLSVSDKSTAPFGNVRSRQPINAVFSPDGRWVAYTTVPVGAGTLSPDGGVFVQPFPATGARFQVPKTNIDYHPAWARDGKELFYTPGGSRPLVAVGVQTQPQVTFRPPVNLPDASRWSMLSSEVRGYDTLPGGRFLGLTRPGEADSTAEPELHVVVNWMEELKRLVPAR